MNVKRIKACDKDHLKTLIAIAETTSYPARYIKAGTTKFPPPIPITAARNPDNNPIPAGTIKET